MNNWILFLLCLYLALVLLLGWTIYRRRKLYKRLAVEAKWLRQEGAELMQWRKTYLEKENRSAPWESKYGIVAVMRQTYNTRVDAYEARRQAFLEELEEDHWFW